MMGDIEDFRDCVEIHCARLAIQNRTEAELEELQNLCIEFESLYKSVSDELTDELLDRMGELDYQIHMKICEMSHNALFRITYQTMRPILVQYIKTVIIKRNSTYEDNKESYKFLLSMKTHRRLYEAIRDRNEEACIKFVKNMIDYKVLMDEDYLF